MVYSYIVDTEGSVLILEFWGCDSRALRDGAEMAGVTRRVTRKMGMRIVHSAFRRLDSTKGVTGFVTGYGGHIAVRAWPGEGYAMVDLYSCDAEHDVNAAVEYLKRGLGADTCTVSRIERGRVPQAEDGMLPSEAEHGV